MNDNQFSSNLLTDCTGNDLNRRYKNVDFDLFNFSSSTAASNDLMTHSCTRSTSITNVSKEQYCASEESRNDTKCLKTSTSSRTDTSEHSYLNRFWNDDNNLLSQKNQNDLLQEQYGNSEGKTFLQKNYNDLVLLNHQTNHLVTNYDINEPSAVHTDASFNVGVSSTINNPESNFSFNNAYQNDNNVKDKRKKFKTNKVSSIQINGNEITLKSKRKRKTKKATLKSQFTASERELFDKYKNTEKNFRRFFRLKIKDQMPQFIKKLEISNLSNDLKQKSILALRNLLSFLDTISAIKVNTRKAKNKKEFLNSFNLAFIKFSMYTGVSQELLVFKLICNNLHRVGDSVFCSFFGCNFYKVNRYLFRIDRRFKSFNNRLLKLREIFEKK